MKDYYSEMEEILNPMKKFNDEINEILNPMKSLMGSISIPTVDSAFKPLPLPEMALSFSDLDLGLTPISLPTIGQSLPNFTSSIAKWQKQLEYDLNPLKKLQEEINLFTNPLKDLQSNLIPMKSALESLSLLQNQTSIFKLNEELQKALQGIDISALNIDESIESELEEQIDSLEKEDKKTLDEILEALKNMFPEIGLVTQAYQKKQYVRILTYFFVVILPFVQNYYHEYTQNVILNSYYKINRNKVRVRTEPSTENPKSIILKLNKNVFVEKIDSHKNWLKIEFEDESGQELEGWVRRDMVTKIEQD
ncbi:hypothetical protein AF78_04940 [Aliarcobacter butzleri L353]|uniref:hypothetical protein n=1 Tax=Aliarcobacter butzleri TaxID=28197 RepID=UPI00065894F0|nr:hypothetical protein [Aliarcobacter butzleri]KLE05843.1 hypothetical protein AF78_04940 [Aliarcobacter butzleri L353]